MIPHRQALAPTCAICVSTIRGEVLREPLGRNDAMVAVCSSCSTERPEIRPSSTPAYFCGEEPHVAGFRRAVDVADRRIVPAKHVSRSDFRNYANVLPVSPGFVVELVLRKVSGERSLTADECKAVAEKSSWFGPEVRYLGVSRGYAVFERPNPELVKRSRVERLREIDPLAALRGMEADDHIDIVEGGVLE